MKSKNIEFNDYVEVFLTKKSYKGRLLKSPESEVVLLKLDSGYNIGFNKKNVSEIKLLKKFSIEKEKLDLKKDSKKPNIGMIITGGTIASKYDSMTGGVSPLTNPEELFKFYPEVFEIANVSRVETPFMKSSENMDFRDWKKLAKSVETLINDSNIKGVVITHGTDTLHYTGAALSFFLKNLNKPVVLTYSQRSIDRASSDANLNLQCSALAAISDISEVMLVGHATMNDDYCFAMPGTKTRKMHSSRRDSFQVINGKPFAKIFPDKIEIISDYRTRKKEKLVVDSKFEEMVALVKVYPGQDSDILDYYVEKGYRGIVLEAMGFGHVPLRESRKSWLGKIKELQKKGVVTCITTQTISGRVNPLVYSGGRELMNTGTIYLDDMLPETAFVKLGWVLGHEEWAKNKALVKEKMFHNFEGEISGRSEY